MLHFIYPIMTRRDLLNLPNNDFCQMVDQRSFNIDGSGSLIALSIPHFIVNLNGEVECMLATC